MRFLKIEFRMIFKATNTISSDQFFPVTCNGLHLIRNIRTGDHDLTLEANQKTLTRDYRGMMLYSLLWRQGMITRPDVSDQMQTVTGDGKKLVTGDRVRRLKNHAEFNLQKSHWRPLIGTEGGSR